MMASSASFSLESEIIRTKPHQPQSFCFLKRSFWGEEVSGIEFSAQEASELLNGSSCKS